MCSQPVNELAKGFSLMLGQCKTLQGLLSDPHSMRDLMVSPQGTGFGPSFEVFTDTPVMSH